jgi:hypothetical protein
MNGQMLVACRPKTSARPMLTATDPKGTSVSRGRCAFARFRRNELVACREFDACSRTAVRLRRAAG